MSQNLFKMHPNATLSHNHNRYASDQDDYRSAYRKDVDRILYSKAYARYIDKTQVVYLMDNDHITHRNLHVQLVSSFSRGIGEALHLNLDLIEAIALGHDVGHPPFGHEGETYLNELSLKYGNFAFSHPRQSCKVFYDIEPLELDICVYDGFLCHDGAMRDHCLVPNYQKTKKEHLEEIFIKKTHPNQSFTPKTLEGCVVKICDTIAYLGKDFEDAIQMGLIKRSDIPNTMLGNTNSSLLKRFANSLIKNSLNKEYITFSKEVFKAIKEIRAFNFQSIYTHPKLKKESDKIKQSYSLLFEMILKDFQQKKEQSHLYKSFLKNKTDHYLSDNTDIEMVVDYISGMTDRFFLKTLKGFLLPSKIDL